VSAPTYRITDFHIHIQPWRQMKPAVAETMRLGKEKHFEYLIALMEDPKLLLRTMDEQGIARVGMVNYPSPNIMGFDDSTNDFAVEYAAADPKRLLPYGGVDPVTTKDAAGSVKRLFANGTRVLKLHPPHQAFAANDYTRGLAMLGEIYKTAEDLGMPVLVHTGTSIFPGARNKFAHPMLVEDVAIDFPKMKIVLCHAGRPLWMNEAVFLARRFPNVYLDISSIPPASVLDYLPRLEELAGKVLWGTDWPAPGVPSPAQNVAAFRALPLKEEAKEKILRTNAEKVFGEKAPAPR